MPDQLLEPFIAVHLFLLLPWGALCYPKHLNLKVLWSLIKWSDPNPNLNGLFPFALWYREIIYKITIVITGYMDNCTSHWLTEHMAGILSFVFMIIFLLLSLPHLQLTSLLILNWWIKLTCTMTIQQISLYDSLGYSSSCPSHFLFLFLFVIFIIVILIFCFFLNSNQLPGLKVYKHCHSVYSNWIRGRRHRYPALHLATTVS